MAWAQDLFAVMPHIEFEHLKVFQNILQDAIMRIKRFSLYSKIIPTPETHNDVLLLLSPSQENLEIPIFDWDVMWQVHNVARDTTNGFMLNDTWYEIDKTSSEKHLPLKDLTTTKAPMVQLKLSTENLRKLQAEDKQHSKIREQLIQGHDHPTFLLDNREILYQKVRDKNKYFKAVLVPEKLRKHILFELHDCFNHPGTNKLYNYVQKCSYWPGIKQDCSKYVWSCKACQMVNLKSHRFINLFMSISKIPMETICMDLIGQLPETSMRSKFVLTAICLLTKYVFMVPIPNKTTQQVVQAYLKHIYAQFGGSRYILTDRGSEFTSQMMHQLASELGFVKIFTSPYTPTGNSIIERTHQFLKHSISKIINEKQVEWDAVCHIAAMAVNVFPTRIDQESPFFLMFHRDCFLPTLTQFLQPKLRYIGDSHMHASLDAIKELYMIKIMSLK